MRLHAVRTYGQRKIYVRGTASCYCDIMQSWYCIYLINMNDVVSEDSSIPLEVDLENNYVHEVNYWKWLCRSDIPRKLFHL